MITYTARLLSVRRQLLPFDNRWYSGLPDRRGLPDLAWLHSSGQALQGDAWRDPSQRVLGCLIGRPGRAAAPLLMLINADVSDHRFTLPAGVWQVALDSSQPTGVGRWHGQGDAELPLPAHTVLLLTAAGVKLDL